MVKQSIIFPLCLLLLGVIVGCGETRQFDPTSSQPSATPASPESAWKTLKGNGVALSVPETYAGGNPKTDLDAIAQKLKQIDPNYENRIESLKNDPSAPVLLAFDMQSAESNFLTNVNVATEKVPQEVTVEEYLDAAVNQISNEARVIDQKVVSLENYQAGRMVTESTIGKIPISRLFYLIKDDNKFWLVTYSTTSSEFEQRLPNFEKSIRSLTFPS